MLRSIGEVLFVLIGYCLGGTMTIAAANLCQIEKNYQLRRPVEFPSLSGRLAWSVAGHVASFEAAAKSFGALPMEVLQAAFWSLDPERTVRKFAEFGRLNPAGDEARRFVELEEWANEGEPLPYPAAEELVERLFGNDLPGSGTWTVGGRAASD